VWLILSTVSVVLYNDCYKLKYIRGLLFRFFGFATLGGVTVATESFILKSLKRHLQMHLIVMDTLMLPVGLMLTGLVFFLYDGLTAQQFVAATHCGFQIVLDWAQKSLALMLLTSIKHVLLQRVQSNQRCRLS